MYIIESSALWQQQPVQQHLHRGQNRGLTRASCARGVVHVQVNRYICPNLLGGALNLDQHQNVFKKED